jgi:Flavin containing amine oxidoreductase
LNRWGGRIETCDFGPFKAEFGPMRYEKPGQKRLMQLLEDLGIGTEEFKQYQAERPDFPVYDLTDSEKGPAPFANRHTTLELLKLGIVRILEGTEWGSDGNRDDPRDEKHDEWLKRLTEDDYDAMRKRAKLGGEFLRDLGFWNALSEVLSHQALMKIRDLGTFYHLIPENPNAIEWIIFWLRGLNPKDRLVSVRDGSRRITEGLELKLRSLPESRVSLRPEHVLAGLKPEPGGRSSSSLPGQTVARFGHGHATPYWRFPRARSRNSPLASEPRYERTWTRSSVSRSSSASSS